ncbi:hypothetical protein PLIP_a2478 [Pseudoalteromonas lipolytica LMEB 39]|nr:hypothetical protein [Pseudoalteromonas lipolytica LMEB 39]
MPIPKKQEASIVHIKLSFFKCELLMRLDSKKDTYDANTAVSIEAKTNKPS